MADKIVTGPVQVFVIGFEKPDFNGQILAELKKARKRGVIRLVDLLFVQKDSGGSISSTMHLTDLSEAERLRLGAVAGGLIGLEVDGLEGMEEGAVLGELRVAARDYGMSSAQLADLADSIPPRAVLPRSWSSSTTGPPTCVTPSPRPVASCCCRP